MKLKSKLLKKVFYYLNEFQLNATSANNLKILISGMFLLNFANK